MSLENIYVARQPIVNAGNELTGFELLFRSTEQNSATVAVVKQTRATTTR